jgi:hypothetical protein
MLLKPRRIQEYLNFRKISNSLQREDDPMVI